MAHKTMVHKKVRWGIISTARIAETAFIPAVRETQRGQIVAVASRSPEKAAAFAQKHEIPRVFDDYNSLLASDEVDAVYNPLPNTMHAEWTAVAATYGKHVFCEKPLAVSPTEVLEMVKSCQETGVLLAEAFVFLYHPQTLKLRQLLDEGAIGNLLQVQAHFTFRLARPSDNIRLNKALGGGGLFDAGSYPITYTRFAFGEEPIAVQAACRIDPDYGIDTRASILLTFKDDRCANIYTGLDALGGPGVTLFGEQGYITIPQPYHPKAQSHFTVHRPSDAETFTFEPGTLPFTPAVEQFHDCVLDGAEPLIKADNAVGTLRIIQATLAAAQTGNRVDLT